MSRRCPLSYELLDGEATYSATGLRKLRVKVLHDLSWSAEEQRAEALSRTTKISIQGVQPKLSAALQRAAGRFELVDVGGKFILKPPSTEYPHMPENEDVTMRLAAACGIRVPLHGLIYAKDASLTYFIERFDRAGRGKLPVEDFAQLAGRSRETKYQSSMEQVLTIVNLYCTFPMIERVELLRRTLFCFVVGNEDMHLKNFSLITKDGKTSFSPAYDLLNTTLLLGKAAQEQLALPLSGKKSKLKRKTFIDYFARELMELNTATIDGVLNDLFSARDVWRALLASSFLSQDEQRAYEELIDARLQALRTA